MIVAARVPAQALASDVIPGLGPALSVLVALGGLAFNIGNVAGAGLGLEALLDIPVKTGAAVSAALAIGLFLSREAGRAMDRFAQAMGVVMIALAGYVAVVSHPPVGEAAARTVFPNARINANKSGRVYVLEVAPTRDGGASLVIKDATPPPPPPPGMTDAERWRAAGMSPDGRPLDLKKLE